MKKIIEYPFGKAHCYDKYVYFERSPNQNLSSDQVKRLMEEIYKTYDGQRFVYISHRSTATLIDLNSYKYINKKQIVGIAVVSNLANPESELVKEQELFEGAFAFFKTLDQAISWAETFDLD